MSTWRSAASPRADGAEIIERFDAIAGIVGAAGVGPAGIAFLEAGTEDDDVGAPFRSAVGAARNGGWKSDFVKGHASTGR